MAGNSSAAVGCLGLIGMVLIASCVFGGGSSDKPAQAEPEAAPQTASVETQPEASTSNASAPDSAAVSRAEGTVAFIIGLNGYHCIKVIDAHKATSTLYDVTCITDHHGHEATYMVNAETNDATKI